MTKQEALELYNKISRDSRFNYLVDKVLITNFIFWTDIENYEQSLKKQILLDYTVASTILILPDSNEIKLTLFANIDNRLIYCPSESFEAFIDRIGIKDEFEQYL